MQWLADTKSGPRKDHWLTSNQVMGNQGSLRAKLGLAYVVRCHKTPTIAHNAGNNTEE